jgi:hypothetical protein
MLVLSAAGLFFALGLSGHADGAVTVAPMTLLAAAGVALV